jgi:hypothetical protein
MTIAEYEEYDPHIRKVIENNHIFEIGVGWNGGLAKFCAELGAASYMGVDIDRGTIEELCREFPSTTFIYDCPIAVLSSLNHDVVTLSTGLFDRAIINNDDYVRRLANAIAQRTAQGSYAMHPGPDAQQFFPHFKNRGFIQQGPRMLGIMQRSE